MGTYIGHFPTLHPDEIVYSVFARYCKRARLSEPFAAMRAFFGHPYSVPVELPSHLDALISNLPQGHPYTADLLIDRHTTFPYYGFFLEENQRDSIREAMRGAGGAGIRSRLGITSGGTKSLLFLRHCPACDVENRRLYGETYWHRLHQIAEIDVCPKHKTFLEETDVPRGFKARNIYMDAESACLPKTPKFLDPLNHTHNLLLKIAADASWLLDNTTQQPTLESVHKGYDFKLAQNGLASYAGTVKIDSLIAKFLERYPTEALLQLDCMMDVQQDKRKQWMIALLYAHQRAQPPVKHLLLIDFLGMPVATFAEELLYGHLQPSFLFGSKPWNCLNVICKDYRAETIQTCTVEDTRPSSEKVIGRFECGFCGFTYSRFGPDQKRYDQLGDGWVNDYGPLWHARLREAWMDNNLNLVEVAENLGVIRKVVRRQATRWNLPFPKPGQRTTKLRSDNPPCWKGNRKSVDPQTMSVMHSQWLDIIANTDADSLKAVAKSHGKVYWFLRRYDNSWIVTHPLRKEKKAVKTPTVDWDGRDDQIAQQVVPAASVLLACPGKPVIVSQLAICRQIGSPVGLYNLRSRMPKFAAALKSTAETRTNFAIRRIVWAAVEIKRKGNSVHRAELVLLAGAGVRKLLSDPTIDAAVTSACYG